jgi:hypothetical protein
MERLAEVQTPLGYESGYHAVILQHGEDTVIMVH